MAALKTPEPLPVMIFEIVSTGCIIELCRLKKTENGQKIARPIYEFKYLNRPNNRANGGQDKLNFTVYREDIDRMTDFKRWKPTQYTPPLSPADEQSVLTIL